MGRLRQPQPLHRDGGLYYLILRSEASSDLFTKAEDYRIFMVLLARACQHCHCVLIACSLLKGEAHLLFGMNEVSVPELARYLIARFTVKADARYAHAARKITDYRYMRADGLGTLQELVDRIHQLPVHAGLCATAEDWPWNGPRGDDTRNDKIAQAAVGERNFQALQRRRWLALRLLREQKSCSEIAQRLNVSARSVQMWAKLFKHQGRRGLKLRRSQAQSMLKPEQHAALVQMLRAGPANADRSVPLSTVWTSAQVARLIREHFGVTYTRSGIWYLMRRLGLPTNTRALMQPPPH